MDSLLGKEAGGLGFTLVFPHNVKSQCYEWVLSKLLGNCPVYGHRLRSRLFTIAGIFNLILIEFIQ